MHQHAAHVAPHGVTLLGDISPATSPLCVGVTAPFNFILTCKPDSHATLSERLAFWQANDGMTSVRTPLEGRVTEVTMVRYLNDVRLAVVTNACGQLVASTVVNATRGDQLYHNSCITNHRLNNDNIVAVAQASRGRWKIENENNNVLRPRGTIWSTTLVMAAVPVGLYAQPQTCWLFCSTRC